jgi:hypothetical protein
VQPEGYVSVDVLREVFTSSRSRGVARNVLTVLADAAHPDGVTWLPIMPSKNGDPTKCLTHRANASKHAVVDAVAKLVALGEIEVRKAQRGRAKINVYRVVLGTIGWLEVDYSDLPFALEQPFGRLGSDPAPSPKGDEVQISGRLGAESVPDWVQFSGSDDQPQSSVASAVEATFAAPQPSVEPSLQPSAVEPSILRDVSEDVEDVDEPAAERQATDREVTEVVRSLPGCDAGSPRVVLPLAYGLPRSTFLDVVERVRARRGRVGLLVDLLRIAQAERTAMLSAQLDAMLGATARRYVPAPWLTDSIRRDDPKRYVRIMAANPSYPANLLPEALDGLDDIDGLVALFASVRAGTESGDRVGTAEQERLRWVDAHAADPDVDHVIDGWDNVDPFERQTLHERAEQLRDVADQTSTRKVA